MDPRIVMKRIMNGLLKAIHENGCEYSRVRQAFDTLAEWLGFTNGKTLLELLNRAYSAK